MPRKSRTNCGADQSCTASQETTGLRRRAVIKRIGAAVSTALVATILVGEVHNGESTQWIPTKTEWSRTTLVAPELVGRPPVPPAPQREVEKLDQAEAAQAARALAEQQRLAAEATRAAHALAERQRLAAERATTERAAGEAAAQTAVKAQARAFVRPAKGTFTSGFGARWGTTHYGVDIANAIGTPIFSVAAGTVVEAGSARGFGLWVRVRHNDGTITVYGHVNTILVGAGRRVAAGDQIATMGNRGNSTGPHLHFEVWQGGRTKINPLPWLRAHGIALG
jgi:murein DD-endopeptidase MepM/ murein hydrolase activator NlpD